MVQVSLNWHESQVSLKAKTWLWLYRCTSIFTQIYLTFTFKVWYLHLKMFTQTYLTFALFAPQNWNSVVQVSLNWHESQVSLEAKTWLWLHAHLTPQLLPLESCHFFSLRSNLKWSCGPMKVQSWPQHLACPPPLRHNLFSTWKKPQAEFKGSNKVWDKASLTESAWFLVAVSKIKRFSMLSSIHPVNYKNNVEEEQSFAFFYFGPGEILYSPK